MPEFLLLQVKRTHLSRYLYPSADKRFRQLKATRSFHCQGGVFTVQRPQPASAHWTYCQAGAAGSQWVSSGPARGSATQSTCGTCVCVREGCLTAWRGSRNAGTDAPAPSHRTRTPHAASASTSSGSACRSADRSTGSLAWCGRTSDSDPS